MALALKEQVDANRKWRESQRDVGHHKPASPQILAVKRKLKDNLQLFLLKCFPRQFYRKFSKDQLTLIEYLEDVLTNGGQSCVALPRGDGKTSILKAASLWAVLTGRRRYMVIIGADQRAANKIIDSIKTMFTGAEMAKYYPEAVHYSKCLEGLAQRAAGQLSEGVPTKIIWKADHLQLAQVPMNPKRLELCSGAIIEARGITSGIRGMQVTLEDGEIIRPDQVILDDPQNRETASSVTQCSDRFEIINSDISGLAGIEKPLAAIAAVTVIRKGDVAEMLLKAWRSIRGKALVTLPVNQTLWSEYVELRRDAKSEMDSKSLQKLCNEFYKAHRTEMDVGAEVGNPLRLSEGDLSPLQYCYNRIADYGEESFASEMQNEPVSSTTIYYNLQPEHILKKCNELQRLELPDCPITITAGIDYNRYGLTWTLLATTETYHSSIIAYGIYQPDGKPVYDSKEKGYSDAEAVALGKALQRLLNEFQQLKIYDKQGYQQRIRRIGIDAGYFNSTVRDYVRSNQVTFPYEIYATKGFASKDYNNPRKGQHGEGWKLDQQEQYVYCNSDLIREVWQIGLLLPAGAPTGVDVFGSPSMHKELALQLSSEQMTLKAEDTKGRLQYAWTVKYRNDIADTLGLARVMAAMGGCRATANLTPALTIPEQQIQPEATQKPQQQASVDTFDMSGWNSW